MAGDVLVLEADAELRQRIADGLRHQGCTTREAGDVDAGTKLVDARRPAVAIVDVDLDGRAGDGDRLIRWLGRGRDPIPVIALDDSGPRNAIANGAFYVLGKASGPEWAPLLVSRVLERERLQHENADLLRRAGGPPELVGQTQAIQQVRLAIDRVAPTGSRVFISGPSGSGKEIVARLIHQRSQRSAGPFVLINCAVYAADELDAAIFGSARHHNGGDMPWVGAAERAHGGTLVLDEVAALPLSTQKNVLRLLHEQCFERLGGSQRVAVDVRVVASSSRDLNQEIAAGRFRQELYHRLNVVPIRTPGLTERREDIPILVDHLMGRAAASLGLPPRQLGEDAIAALQAYSWPGNVRQLRTAMEWLLIAGGSDPVSAAELPPDVVRDVAGALDMEGGSEMMALPLRDAREIFERHYLVTQLTRFGGNISKTASFVGMERTALHRKLKSLGVAIGEKLS